MNVTRCFHGFLAAVFALGATGIHAAGDTFRFYRFKVEATQGEALQISELKLYSGEQDISAKAAKVLFDTTTRASNGYCLRPGYEPTKALDGDPETKWFDDRADAAKTRDAVWLSLEYAAPVEVTRYSWYVAGDTNKHPRRNPRAWRFQASADGRDWTDLDVVTDAQPSAQNLACGYVWRKGSPKPVERAHSLLTRDGRRLVDCRAGDAAWRELVPTNALPAGLPPVREWKIYCLSASHTDIGLHHSQYVQRHGSVVRTDAARKLVAADPDDADPAAYRYMFEGCWFFDNYPMERGEAATRALVANEMRRGRLGVSALCAGNITEAYGFEQMCRSAYARKRLEDRWGLKPKTMVLADIQGVSWSVVQPYAEAGVENLVFLPNQWNPLFSTIWPRDRSKDANDPDGGGGGSRVDVRWDSPLPFVFWWEAADRSSRMLVFAGNHYRTSGRAFGLLGGRRSIGNMERTMPGRLAKMEERYPFDVWLTSFYCDDEWPNSYVSDKFRMWNAKWRWPEMHTVASPDEPLDLLRAKWGDKIATLRGNITSGWVQFPHSMPECLGRKLAADRNLAATEAEASVAAVTEGAAYPAEDFARAWWGLVMNDEHSYATPDGYQGRRVFETSLQHFDWVEKAEQTAARFATGKRPEPMEAKGQSGECLENKWYRVKQANGLVTSIYDKELGRELLNAPANDLRYTRDNHRTWERDAAAALGAEVMRSVRLDPDEKRIWVETEIRHAKNLRCTSEDRYRRYGYLAFPFDVPGGTFYAQLNGPVMRPYLDLTGHSTDAYVGAHDWVGVENGEFGVALVQFDSMVVEFGEIHPDKTCYTGKPPVGNSAIFPALFNDWLVEHKPDGESFNFRYRYAITSYRGTWQDAHIPAFASRTVNPRLAAMSAAHVKADQPNVILCGLKAAEDGLGLIARFRETEGRATTAKVWQDLLPDAKAVRNTILEKPWTDGRADVLDLKPFQYATVRIANGRKIAFAPPDDRDFKYTGLITAPKATHGERLGQLYLEWGLDPSPDFDHWELYRGETPDFPRDAAHFVDKVRPHVLAGLAFAVNRYDDRGLKTHTRYHYAIRTVRKSGEKGPFHTFSAMTRDNPKGVLGKYGEGPRHIWNAGDEKIRTGY